MEIGFDLRQLFAEFAEIVDFELNLFYYFNGLFIGINNELINIRVDKNRYPVNERTITRWKQFCQ